MVTAAAPYKSSSQPCNPLPVFGCLFVGHKETEKLHFHAFSYIILEGFRFFFIFGEINVFECCRLRFYLGAGHNVDSWITRTFFGRLVIFENVCCWEMCPSWF